MQSRELARTYLIRLDLEKDPRFTTDPVALLGDVAVGKVSADKPAQSLTIASSTNSLVTLSEQHNELGRGMLMVDGTVWVDDATRSFKVDTNLHGMQNVLVIDRLTSSLNPFDILASSILMRLEGTVKIRGASKDKTLELPIDSGQYNIQVCWFENPGLIDLVIVLNRV